MFAMHMSTPFSPNVSRETFSRLDAYVALLLKWNEKINLIGPSTADQIWKRHIDDSLQLVSLIPETASKLVDLGSGAGLPGLVIAIHCPELLVTLIEQDQRKAAFLTEVKHRLTLDRVSVINADIATHHQKYDVVTARALAPLNELLLLAKPLMEEEAIGLFPKGVGAEKEIEQARQHWGFEATQKPSATQDGASIITISKLTRTNG